MFIVYDKKMNIKPFPQGVRPLDIYIHSIEKRRQSDTIEGRNGIISSGHTHGIRPIEIKVGLLSYDTFDYRLLRDEVYAYFDDEEFYISESYQRGKRYKVTTLQSYIPDRLDRTTAQAQFLLDMVELPYAESIGTTLDIHNNGISYDTELWSYGMGLLYDNDSHKYIHSNSTFKIYNAGNIDEHHPFEEELKITITGANNGYELKNTSTGDVFNLKEKPSGTIVLDGPSITDNGLQAYGKTNGQYITLNPGWNEFTQNQNATVSFDFPFYYK